MNWKDLFTSKTFWTAIIGIVTGIGMIVQGNTSEGIQLILTSLIGIFIRDALVKKESK